MAIACNLERASAESSKIISTSDLDMVLAAAGRTRNLHDALYLQESFAKQDSTQVTSVPIAKSHPTKAITAPP